MQGRNRQQAYNVSKQQKSKDPLYDLIIECKNIEGETQYIREIKLVPEPSLTLAMDYQLSDIQSFCTNPAHYCVLGIDPTFKLGPFNVTVTTYKHYQLIKRDGKAPTFIGPLFVHYRKTFSCYNTFASSLNKAVGEILAFGTDGEDPLIEAFARQCQLATHLTCFTHCKGNIKCKLKEIGIPADNVPKYPSEIFGSQQGSTFMEGLVDSSSSDEFDENLQVLEVIWNNREQQINSPPQFFSYFKKNKVAVFKDSMIKPVRIKGGLGDPPVENHNNCPECMNNVIKMKVDRKRN